MREGIGSLARILKTIEVSSRIVPAGYWSCITYSIYSPETLLFSCFWYSSLLEAE
jgi:hypothetical protein